VSLRPADRLLWVTLSRVWPGWRSAVILFKPETVIGWYRRGFRLFWRWKSRGRLPGRPAASCEVIDLIETMHEANPTGAPLGFTANCSSSGFKSHSRRYRSICRGRSTRRRRDGARSCATICPR
jgi:hypothetical protein